MIYVEKIILRKNSVKKYVVRNIYFTNLQVVFIFQIFKELMRSSGEAGNSVVVDLGKCSAYKTMYYNGSNKTTNIVKSTLFLSTIITILSAFYMWLLTRENWKPQIKKNHLYVGNRRYFYRKKIGVFNQIRFRPKFSNHI